MAEQSAVARGQQRRDEEAVLGEQFWRHHRVHAPMDPVHPAGAQCPDDPGAADARGRQLRPADDPRLLTRDRPNWVGLGSVSGLNPTQFRHAAIVGAPAVPALHAFVTTLR